MYASRYPLQVGTLRYWCSCARNIWPVYRKNGPEPFKSLMVASYDRTEGCDVLTSYNQHADVVVTRVVLPDSTSQVCLVPDEMIEQLRVDKALTSSRRKKRPGLVLEAGRSQSGRSDAATHRTDRRQGRVAAGSFTASVRRKFEIRQDRYAIAPHARSSLRSFVRGRDLISRSYNVTLRAIQGLSTR